MAFRLLAMLIWDIKFELLAIAATTFLIGEIWLRVPVILQRLEYHPDRVMGAKLRPDQRGFSWLAEMSLKSPPITVNSDGYRGKEVDWSKPAIIAVGASDTFGSSVGDHDVWSNKLEMGIRQSGEFADYVVINAGHPGFGPSHHILRIQRFLERKTPDLIIARVGIGMRFFRAPENDRQALRQFKQAKTREKIRKATRFFPFLYNKSKIQITKLKQAVIPFFLQKKQQERREAKKSVADHFWNDNKAFWFQIIELSESKGIPLIFCISDMTGLKSDRIVTDYLRDASNQFPNVYVLYLGPDTVDLEGIDYKFAKKIYRENYTLRMDLHGNPRQHQILADNHLKFIRSNGLLKQFTATDTKLMLSKSTFHLDGL